MDDVVFLPSSIPIEDLSSSFETVLQDGLKPTIDLFVEVITRLETFDRFEEASRWSTIAVETHPLSLELQIKNIKLLTRLHKSKDAVLASMAACSALLPLGAAGLAEATAESLKEAGFLDQAYVFFATALRLDPNSQYYQTKLVIHLINTQRYDEAAKYLIDFLNGAEFFRNAESVSAIIQKCSPTLADQLAELMTGQRPNWSMEYLFRTKYKFPQAETLSVSPYGQEILPSIDTGEPLKDVFANVSHPISNAIQWMPRTEPTRLILLENVILHVFDGGFVVTNRNGKPYDLFTSYIFDQFIQKLPLSGLKLIEKLFWVGDIFGSNNYCHWMVDYMPRIAFAYDHFPDYEIAMARDYYKGAFQAETLELTGIPSNKILKLPEGSFVVEKFAVLTSSTKNYAHCFQGGSIDYARFLFRKFPPRNHGAHRRIYVFRPRGLGRCISNDAEVQALLEKYGFEPVNPGGLSVKQQMELFGSASHIVSPHGAALTNLIFCLPRTRILEIFPPASGSPAFVRIALMNALDYTLFVGDGDFSTTLLKTEKNRQDFHVDLKTFEPLVQKFLR